MVVFGCLTSRMSLAFCMMDKCLNMVNDSIKDVLMVGGCLASKIARRMLINMKC